MSKTDYRYRDYMARQDLDLDEILKKHFIKTTITTLDVGLHTEGREPMSETTNYKEAKAQLLALHLGCLPKPEKNYGEFKRAVDLMEQKLREMYET